MPNNLPRYILTKENTLREDPNGNIMFVAQAMDVITPLLDKVAALEAALSAAEPVAWTEPRELAKIEGDETGAFWKPRENERQIPLYASPPAPSVAVKATPNALEQFTAYFVKNYPGPDTIIFDPKWHAPKIFRAAVSALSAQVQDDWTVSDTECASEILLLLGIGSDPSKEPGADWRRDKVAAIIRRYVDGRSAQVQDVATVRDALQAIANLPTGFNIDVCRGHEEAYRAVEALLSTPPDVQVQDVVGWQPIETAPKDGTNILVWADGYQWPEVARYEIYDDPIVEAEAGEKGYWRFSEDLLADITQIDKDEISHWMPLPSAPAKQEGVHD